MEGSRAEFRVFQNLAEESDIRPNAADIVFAPNGLTGTGVTVPAGKLAAGTPYYWQVRAYHGASAASAWSVIFQFQTPAAPPPEDGTPQDYVFCEECPGFFRRTIHVTATSFAAAEAEANRRAASGCFISPGPCPDGRPH